MRQRVGDPRVAVFLAAEAFSAIGSWATIIAVWGFAAFRFDAGAADLAWFGIAFSVPPVLLGPLSGSVIDRAGARPTLGAAKVLGALASLALLAADSFAALAALTAVHGTADAFARPALQALPPRLVPPDRLAGTNTIVAMCEQLAIVLGPAAGGLAIAWFGFRGAFVFDAVTYAIGVVALPIVRLRPVPPAIEGFTWRGALDGWRTILRSRLLTRTVFGVASVTGLYGLAIVAEPLYVRDVLERSPEVFAWLQVAFGVFLIALSMVVVRLGDRVATLGAVLAGVGLSGVFAAVYLATSSIVVAFAGVSVWGAVTAFIEGPSRTLLQRGSAPELHGRVLAADQMAASFAQLVGTVIAGLAIAGLGVQVTAVIVGAIIAALALTLALGGRDEGPDPAAQGLSEAMASSMRLVTSSTAPVPSTDTRMPRPS